MSVAAAALLGCATDRSAKSDAWAEQDVSGHTLTLQHAMRVESFRFADHGDVAAELGQKSDTAAVKLQWKIVGRRLRISDGSLIYEELVLVSRDGSNILARRGNGHLARYRLR